MERPTISQSSFTGNDRMNGTLTGLFFITATASSIIGGSYQRQKSPTWYSP